MPVTLEKTKTPLAGETASAASGFGVFRVAAVWALIIFAATNLVLWKVTGDEKSVSKDLWGGSGSIDLAVNGFKSLKQAPTVVLLGSSLMMFPFYAMDAEIDKNPGDIFHHHQSETLARQLAKDGFKDPSVYSLAIFGQMASDAFIYVDEFLKGAKQPQWLVLGIAPRDFSDHDLPAPMATFTFKRLVGLSNFGRYSSLYLPQWQDKMEFVCSHVCYFYNRRWRLQQEFGKAVNKLYAGSGLAAQPPKETKVSEADAGFMLSGTAEERFNNSLKEYRRRYRDIGEKDLSVQMGFLDKLLADCHDRGIKVALINMPLTSANRDLLPPGFYDRFRGAIAERANSHDAKLLDLGASPEFDLKDFWDSTHLNHVGGHKLVQHLMSVIKP